MDRAEAIKRIDALLSKCWTGAAVASGDDFKALSMAIAALREQELGVEMIKTLLIQKGFGVEGAMIAAEHLARNGVGQSKWISVKERLPEYSQSVLVIDTVDCRGYMGIWSLEKDKDDGSDCWEDDGGWWQPLAEVTHWMPLPEPPKEGVEG